MTLPLIDLVAGLLIFAVVLGWLGRRLNLPYPIALTLGGLAISQVPGLPRPEIDPQQILVLVLPPILYHAALFTSWREFRANFRSISMLAVGLVLFTMVVLAAIAKLLLPGLPWPCAFILGALLSPPDAVAATAVLSRLRMPRRLVTILEGESLLNDAAGLVVYKFAVAAALTGTFSLPAATAEFGLLAAGGVVFGYLCGRVAVWVQVRLKDPLIEMAFSLTLPYLAYILAEHMHISGVLAVVVLGGVRAWYSPELFGPATRLLAQGTWNTVVFLINSLVFILIGLQLAEVNDEQGIPAYLLMAGLALALGSSVARFAWVFPSAWIAKAVMPKSRESMPPASHLSIISWCGMRGIVSLAAALAIPFTMPDGTPFPGRGEIIVLAFVVILATLLVQGLTLSPLIRWLGIGEDADIQEEEHLARQKTAYAAITEVERLAAEGRFEPEVVVAVRAEFDSLLLQEQYTNTRLDCAEDPVRALKLAALGAARRRLVKLRRESQIGDETLLAVQRDLDYEEARLGGD